LNEAGPEKSEAGVSQALEVLEAWGMLLLQDPKLPSLVGLIANEPVRGSWWGHPKGGEIFHAAGQLDDHPDVATAKLVSGKVTFVHRRLWPQLIAVGRSRQDWQTQGLTSEARALLVRVDKEKRLQASGKHAKSLEARLLVASRQVHTDSGAHATELMAWETFAHQTKAPRSRISAARARAEIEQTVRALNDAFAAKGKLPWDAYARRI
jgi:hypothetical protein